MTLPLTPRPLMGGGPHWCPVHRCFWTLLVLTLMVLLLASLLHMEMLTP